MKTYRVIYKFQYELDVEASSAEEAASIAGEMVWDDSKHDLWTETWEGPLVHLGTDAVVETLFQGLELHKKGEESE